jgi:L,D-transpeptidase YbiS
MTESDPGVKQIFVAAGWDGIAPALLVRGGDQTLELLSGRDEASRIWPVSTGLAGFGNRENSGCTPTGLHRISACIGAGASLGSVFKGRELTGEVVGVKTESGGDYITSRILWLDGLELGINQGGEVDSHNRYIYIHGTPYEQQLGQPVSAGCVRMANTDVLELFDLVQVETLVLILEE